MAQSGGAQGSPVQLSDGLTRTKKQPDLNADDASTPYHQHARSFIHSGSETPVANSIEINDMGTKRAV